MNLNPNNRGFSANGAPRGYGQQRGSSPFLDNPRREGMEREGPVRAPMAHEPNAPAAPEDPSQPTWQEALIGGNPAAPAPQQPQVKQPATAAMAPQGPVSHTMPVGGQQFGAQPTAAAAPQSDPAAEQAWRMQLRQQGLANQSGASRGWNTSDYGGDERAATSMKNTFHAIAQRYPSTPSGLRALMQDPDFQRAFPGATLEQGRNGDVVNFNGILSDFSKGTPVRRVDVGFSFDGAADTGGGWDWMDIDNAQPGGAQAMGAPIGAAPQQDDVASRLLAALQGEQGQNANNVSIEQLLSSMGLI